MTKIEWCAARAISSLRRDGKSLGQMAKEEINAAAGVTGMLAVLFIMVILLAVLALIVVNALKASPWGLFTIACTIPIAFLMGWWMKVWRPGAVGEASAVGAVLLLGRHLRVRRGAWVAGEALDPAQAFGEGEDLAPLEEAPRVGEPRVARAEFTSIATIASVWSITIAPPEGRFTVRLNAVSIWCSIWNRENSGTSSL